MKRSILVYLAISIITACLLLAGYFFLHIRPKNIVPKKLLESEKTITEQHLNLLQNRLSIMSLVNLDTNTGGFAEKKDSLLQTALETNQKGIKTLEKSYESKKITGIGNNHVEFLNNELNKEIPILLENNKKILEQQKIMLDTLINLDNKIKNIFKYAPTIDLKNLDIKTDKEEIINRAALAHEGLEKINIKLENWSQQNQEYKKEVDRVIKSIRDAQILLNDLSDKLTNNKYEAATTTIDNIVKKFEEIRKVGIDLELAIIRNPRSVEQMKDQTNLILKYEFWLKKIDQHQKEIAIEQY